MKQDVAEKCKGNFVIVLGKTYKCLLTPGMLE